jgi:hypothetical protein
MAQGSTQPLTEMSTRNVSRGIGDRFVGLTTLSPSGADLLKIWEAQPPGTLRARQELLMELLTERCRKWLNADQRRMEFLDRC